MRAGHHEELILLLGQVRNGERDLSIEGAHEDIHAVFLDELGGGFQCGLNIRGVVGFQNRDLTS